MAGAKRYRAFISYSQADMAPAQRLHRALENYRVPLGIAPDAVAKDRKLGRFFRDMDEMGAATDISATVRGAIDDSESLIVVCSPRSAKSKWVEAEIQHFRATGRGDKVYAVIIDGTPNSANPETECFPAGLRATYAAGEMPMEPVGIDLRKESLDRACTRIAAGLLGVRFDDLWQRARREARKRLMFAGVAAAGVAIVAGGVMVAIWSGQAREAGRSRSAQLAEAARAASDAGLYDRAARYALVGLSGADDALTGFDAREAEIELRRALAAGLTYIVRTDDKPAPGPTYEPTWREASFSPDGARILTGGQRGSQLRDAATGAVVTELSDAHTFGEFSPDGARLVVFGAGGAELRETATGRVIAALAMPDEVEIKRVRFSADGAVLASVGEFQVISLWDGRTGQRLRDIDTPGTVAGFWVTPDGSELVALTNSGDVVRWSVATGAQVAAWRTQHQARAEMSPDGRHLLINSQSDEQIVMLDMAGRQVRTFSNADHVPGDFAFAAGGARIVVGTYDGDVDVYDAATGQVVNSWVAEDGPIERIIVRGERVLTRAVYGSPQVWTMAGGAVATLAAPSHIDALSLSDDGTQALAGSLDGALRRWSLDAMTAGSLFASSADMFTPPAFSPDGKLAAIALGDGVGGVEIRSLADARVVASTTAGDGNALALAFSPDGAQVLNVMADEAGARVWQVADGKEVGRIAPGGGMAIASVWGAKGPRTVLLGPDGPEVRDAMNGQRVAVLDALPGVARANFSPDGAMLAMVAIGTDGMEDEDAVNRALVVTLCDAETGKELRRLSGHTAQVFDAVFSPDGKRLLTISQDRTVRLWDVATGETLRTFADMEAGVLRPVFSRDGRLALVANQSDIIAVLDLETGAATPLRGIWLSARDASFGADESIVVSLNGLQGMQVWDRATGRTLAATPGAALWQAWLTPSGQIMTVAEGGDVRLMPMPETLVLPRGALVSRACSVLLPGLSSRLTAEELAAVPVLDAARQQDACRR